MYALHNRRITEHGKRQIKLPVRNGSPAGQTTVFSNQFLFGRDTLLTGNLGDNRTLAIPVAHTIFHEMGAERRASMGILVGILVSRGERRT